MKKVAIAVILFLCGMAAQSQGLYVPKFTVIYGVHDLRHKSDSAQHIPEKVTLAKNTLDTSAQIFYYTGDSSIYAYSKAKGFWKIGNGDVSLAQVIQLINDSTINLGLVSPLEWSNDSTIRINPDSLDVYRAGGAGVPTFQQVADATPSGNITGASFQLATTGSLNFDVTSGGYLQRIGLSNTQSFFQMLGPTQSGAIRTLNAETQSFYTEGTGRYAFMELFDSYGGFKSNWASAAQYNELRIYNNTTYGAFRVFTDLGSYYFPRTSPTTGQYLVANGSNGLDWGTGGVTTLAAIGSSPNANGATISGSTLNLQPASGSFGGVVTTGAQTLIGPKTFSSNIYSLDRFGAGTSLPTAQIDVTLNGLGTTSNDTAGIVLANNTVAANGAQQKSPSVLWRGQAWKTLSTAASQTVEFQAFVLPVQGIAAKGTWTLQKRINGGSWVDCLTVTEAGAVTATTALFGTTVQVTSGVLLNGANSLLYLNGDPGTAGQKLTSMGSGATPVWKDTTAAGIPYTGASSNVDIGSHTLTTTGNGSFNNLNATGLTTTVGINNTGGVKMSIRIETSDYTATTADYTISVNNGATPVIITFPHPASCAGQIFIVKRYDDTSTGSVTISGGGGNIQDRVGAFAGTTTPLDDWGIRYSDKRMYQSNGTEWEYIQ